MNTPKPYLWLYTVILISCILSSCSKTQNTSLGTVFPLTAGGGDTLTITGKNLALNGATPVVKLNDQPMTIIKSEPDQLQVIVPKMAGSGKITAIIGNKTYTGPDFTYKYKATVSTLVGSGSFYDPWGITADDNGDLYVAECYGRSIKKVTSAGQVSTISLPVTINGGNFFSPYNITLDKAKHDLYVTDFNAHLLKIGSDMSMSVIYNGDMPTTGIAFGADGYLYMSNNTQGVIYQMNTDGSNVKTFASGIRTPRNIIFDQSNNMYVAGYNEADGSAAIFGIDKKGTPKLWVEDKAFGGWEIAIDKAGNFYEADHFNNVIKMIEKNGRPIVIAGNGNPADVDGVGLQASFNGPQGLAIDAEGNLYVSTYNYTTGASNEIRKIVIE